MNNSEKIAKLKLALRGLDLHIKPLNKNVNMFDHFLKSKYCIKKATEDLSKSKKDKYLVTTINWTYTNLKSDADYNPEIASPNFDEVYKYQYVLTIEELIKLKTKLSKSKVREQIIKIEPFITDTFF
jgi:hypothetical protein